MIDWFITRYIKNDITFNIFWLNEGRICNVKGRTNSEMSLFVFFKLRLSTNLLEGQILAPSHEVGSENGEKPQCK